MIKRLGFIVLAVALMVSDCGRQVTPNKPGLSGPPAGFMQVKFRVQAPFNFNSYSYVIVLNTTGATVTPEAYGSQTNYQGYSFAIVVTGSGGAATATPFIFQRPNGNQNAVPFLYGFVPVNGQLQLSTNSNGQNTEFTVLFDRNLAAFLATPSPSPSPTASASPTASPTGSPSASPSASPSPGVLGSTWYFNYFVVNGNITQSGVSLVGGPGGTGSTNILDSLGSGGAQDYTYSSPALNVLTTFDTGTFYAAIHNNPPADPASAIAGGDISNTP